MPIWKTTIVQAIRLARLAAIAVHQQRAPWWERSRLESTYRVPVVDHRGRTVQ